VTRTEIEQEEGWPRAKLRLAVIGQPRAEKNVRLVIEAVEACRRTDVHLVARATTDVTSADPRVTVEYGHQPDRRFRRRMAAFDAIVLPFTSEGMLTTGTVFDCIGSGTAALTSHWEFLNQVLGDAAVRYGHTAEDLAACIDNLTDDRLANARSAVASLRDDYDWSAIALRTLAAMERL
jgi:glycosyltransferase involved in cell wall biosynthesis